MANNTYADLSRRRKMPQKMRIGARAAICQSGNSVWTVGSSALNSSLEVARVAIVAVEHDLDLPFAYFGIRQARLESLLAHQALPARHSRIWSGDDE